MKKVLCVSVVLVAIFFTYITYYKFFNYSKGIKLDDTTIELGDLHKEEYNINYVEKYSENILTNLPDVVEYEIISENSASYGKVYITETGQLVIKDEISNKVKVLSDKVFSMMYKVSNQYVNHLYLLALTIDGDVYELKMYNTNMEMVKLKKVDLKVKVTNFTNLSFASYNGHFLDSAIVLGDDKKMYDVNTGFLFNEKIVNVFNEYVVYDDNTVSNINGNMLVNKNGEKYKVKSIILPSDKLDLYKNPSILIITNDNKIIYLTEDKGVYEYEKKVKKISVLSDNITISIEFVDGTDIKFVGLYDYNKFPI